MTSQFTEDQFGLFHATVPHPRMPRDVQLMLVKVEDRWCAYADGERLEATFKSMAHAERHVLRATMAGQRSRMMVGALVAACMLILGALGVTAIVVVTGPPSLEEQATLPAAPVTSVEVQVPKTKPDPVPNSPEVHDVFTFASVTDTETVSRKHVRPRFKRAAKRRKRRRVRQPYVWAKDIQMPTRD